MFEYFQKKYLNNEQKSITIIGEDEKDKIKLEDALL
jgi:hypothetical protein